MITKKIESDTIIRLELRSVEEGTVGADMFSFDNEVAQVTLPEGCYSADMLESMVKDLRDLERLEDTGKL